jgi:putative transcriptional regulator
MDKKLFSRLVESMGQMDEVVRGVRAPSREFFVDAAKVKEIRAITGLSQPKFAKLLHVMWGLCATGNRAGASRLGLRRRS